MNLQEAPTFIGVIFVLLIRLISANQGVLWRPLEISRSLLSTGAKQSDTHGMPSSASKWILRYGCAHQCLLSGWCNLWCHDPNSATSCLLFYMFVSDGYLEPAPGDTLTCYTRRFNEYAARAVSIEASAPYSSLFPSRLKENLIDGIYKHKDLDQCFCTLVNYRPWFKIDLGSVKPIRHIMLVLQHSGGATAMYDFEARVGIDDVPSDAFETRLTFFGYFPAPSQTDQVIHFYQEKPVMGRFVTIQRMTPDDVCNPDGTTERFYCKMQICHIEVY